MLSMSQWDSKPIYEQIRERIKKLIVSKAMVSGEKLPSVREMASQMSINPNTIQRAYRELEAEGYIYSLPGKGSFVSQENNINEKKINELYVKLSDTVVELKYSGETLEAITGRVSGYYDDV